MIIYQRSRGSKGRFIDVQILGRFDKVTSLKIFMFILAYLGIIWVDVLN